MKSVRFGTYVLSGGVALALLTGCSALSLGVRQSQGTLPNDTQPPIGASGAIPRSAGSYGYRILHSFTGGSDGEPSTALTYLDGKLYGTTSGGVDALYALGEVFSLSTTGAEKVLHSFAADPAAGPQEPRGALIALNHILYGTTVHGGGYQHGTVFSLTLSGKMTQLYGFGSANNGAYPLAGLTNVHGTFYGTTEGGTGYDYNGIVFSVTPSGDEKVLHNFASGPTDGSQPYSGLIYVKGVLYGTTLYGGAYNHYDIGAGTVFSITPSGSEKVLYNFNPQTGDGFQPAAGLTNINGTLYGTTWYGGGSTGGYGCGTVFSVTTSGVAKVIHSFDDHDGCMPFAPLLNVRGTLYGTTWTGGEYGRGTVFSMTPSGSETILHSFGNDGDGYWPWAGLIDVKGALYGTTTYGGQYDQGTAFALTP